MDVGADANADREVEVAETSWSEVRRGVSKSVGVGSDCDCDPDGEGAGDEDDDDDVDCVGGGVSRRGRS